MEFDMEPMTLLWTGIFYTVFMIGFWSIKIGGSGFSIKERIVISVLAIPCIYFVFTAMKNR